MKSRRDVQRWVAVFREKETSGVNQYGHPDTGREYTVYESARVLHCSYTRFASPKKKIPTHIILLSAYIVFLRWPFRKTRLIRVYGFRISWLQKRSRYNNHSTIILNTIYIFYYHILYKMTCARHTHGVCLFSDLRRARAQTKHNIII